MWALHYYHEKLPQGYILLDLVFAGLSSPKGLFLFLADV